MRGLTLVCDIAVAVNLVFGDIFVHVLLLVHEAICLGWAFTPHKSIV